MRVPAACVIGLVTLGTVAGGKVVEDGCSETQRSTDIIRLEDKSVHLASGSPVPLALVGEAGSNIDVGDVKLRFKVEGFLFERNAEEQGAFRPADLAAEFELDLCTDVRGVSCPLLQGEIFSGRLVYNAFEVPEGSVLVAERETVQVHEEAFPDCSMRSVHPNYYVVEKVIRDIFDNPAITKGHIVAINRSPRLVGWKPEVSPRFDGYTMADARRITGGTVMRGQLNFEELPRRRYVTAPPEEMKNLDSSALASSRRHLRTTANNNGLVFVDPSSELIPETFDAREAFPQCASIIGRIRDQSDCGSCWAFASTEAFNDRRCIAGIVEGKEDEEATADQLLVLSAEDTTACCHGFSCGLSMGCNGGQPGSAWRWFARKGVVTGGDFSDIGKGTTCKPYEFQPCAHHVDPGASGYPACPDGEYPTPECLTECSDYAFTTRYQADKKLAKEAYSLSGIESIQRDMARYGSVTASFNVYSDFIAYSGGVYRTIGGDYMGGHAVKIIGWGTDDASGDDYWLVANSWNPSWGEGGLFRILRGVNECGIEGNIVAGEV